MNPSFEDLGKIYSMFFSGAITQKELTLPEMTRLLNIIKAPPPGVLDEFREFLIGNNVNFDLALERVQWLYTEQDRTELGQMLSLIRGSTSLLEVGSRFGGTLWEMSKVLAPASTVVSVDAPMGDKVPAAHKPKESLQEAADKIAALGHKCVLVDADSQLESTVARVREFGSFDFCFIDADHSYEGVAKDWRNYGPISKTVGFHDIAGEDAGCVRFWNELKQHHKHAEFINPLGKRKLGIGIIFQ